LLIVLLSCKEEDSPIISELDELGIDIIPLAGGNLGGDLSFVLLVAIGASQEEEVVVDLVHVLLESLLEDVVCLVALLSFKSMGDLMLVNSGDEAICNRPDSLVKVGLSGEDVECSLRGDQHIVWGDSGGDEWIEWDWQGGRQRRRGGGRLIGEIDG
jgi:hypothetical protein